MHHLRRYTAALGVVTLLAPAFAQAAGGYLYVTSPWDNAISVVNLRSRQVDATINIDSPFSIMINGTGAYVTNGNSNSVSIIDITSNQVEATINVGDIPFGIAINGTGAYVTNGNDDTVSMIDTTQNQVEATISVNDIPQGVAASGTGVYVVNYGSNSVSVIDVTSNQVEATINVGAAPFGIAINGTGAYVTNGNGDTVSVIDITQNRVEATIGVNDNPQGVAASGTGVYVVNNGGNSVSVIDVTSNQVEATVVVGTAPSGIAINGTGAYVMNTDDDSVSVIDITQNQVEATIADLEDAYSAAIYLDTTTLEPSLTLPASVPLCDDLSVQYVLPEDMLPESATLQFYNEDTHLSVTATLNSGTGAVSFHLDLENFAAAANVISTTGGNSIIAGNYTVYLSYQDQFGNTAADVEDNDLTVTACASSSSFSSEQTGGGGGGGGGGCRGSNCRNRQAGTVRSSSHASSRSSSSSAAGTVTEELCQAVADAPSFSDVRESAWYGCFTKNVAGLKIFEGYKEVDGTPKGIFGPSDNITMGQLAKVATILRNTGDLDPKPTGDGWYRPYIDAVQSYDAAVFTATIDPLAPATRAQVILTILEALQIPLEYAESPYSDVPESDIFWGPIVTATKLGVVSGDDGATTFRPQAPVNRAEVAKMLSLALAHVGLMYKDDALPVASSSSRTSSAPSLSMACTNIIRNPLRVLAGKNQSLVPVATLLPQQTLSCVSDGPGWYKVFLSDGSVGYVQGGNFLRISSVGSSSSKAMSSSSSLGTGRTPMPSVTCRDNEDCNGGVHFDTTKVPSGS